MNYSNQAQAIAQAGTHYPAETAQPKLRLLAENLAMEVKELFSLAETVNGIADSIVGSSPTKDAPISSPRPVPNGAIDSLTAIIGDLGAARSQVSAAVNRFRNIA